MSIDPEEFKLLQTQLNDHIEECDMNRAKEDERWNQMLHTQEVTAQNVKELTESTKDLLAAWDAANGAVKVLAALGAAAKWAGSFTILGGFVAWLLGAGD